ncbi:MAG TPA: DUF5107 domain-containing protein [Roseiflexaceae bacterium]|nr:DUF5107 domain-containing protein [Roseiflexaceae bacterium]
MTVTVSTEWSYNGIPAVILENRLLRAAVLPALGAKIWQLTYLPAGRELLWHHPRIRPRPLPFHSTYDDVFFGGWDELFPNDLAEELGGERMPDHGEVWTLPWDYALERVTPEEAVLHLWVETPISACRVEKWLALRAGEPKLRFRHRITNLGRHEQPFLWKLHPALAVDEHSRIDMGAREVYVEDFGPPRNGRTGVRYHWPFLTDDEGRRHDMRRCLPASAGVNEFQYATELDGGWCALTHTRERIGLGLAWEREKLPSCWIFASYGGWRALQVAILEPCTGYPVSVADGVARGTHQLLAPGASLVCDVTATVYTGVSGVAHIDADGNVTADETDS